jgi:uncharacterized protein involved in outer membrane biogenesis
MKWLTRIGVGVLALVAALALVPSFVTLDDYVPVLEKEISARLEEPVSIDRLRASMLPVPRVEVDGIAIGADRELKVGELTVQPDLWSLFGARKVIRRIEFEDVTLSHKALGALIGLAQRDSGSASVTVESVRLRNAVLKLENARFGPFDAQVEVETGGKRGAVTLATHDGALDARITPEGDRYVLEISARAWTPPLGPAIRFDELKVKGIAGGSAAELDSITAKLYGGTAAGKAIVRWDKGVSIKANLELKHVELKHAAALASTKARISGKLDAKPVFTASAPKASQLDEALRIETPFTVRNGVLHGVDLTNATAAIIKQGATSGETRFDQLSGYLVRQGKAYRFTQLKIASGALAAQGHIAIAPTRALSGQLHTSVRAVGAAASLPLTVAGTLDEPLVYPSTAALIGGAAGTAVLPGVGTAAGVKLGEIVEGLLGKKK